MDVLIIIVFLYAFLIVFDLVPYIKKKDKKVILLSVPIYLFTLVIDIMANFGTKFPYINDIITQIIKTVFRIS
ncbi:MAG TPA: hypothetical protein VHO71_06835 [Caproiciproducens sp.]|jgi:hypothetical protein|nr:hypothetical protein [Caproiciproducens sp.]